MSTPADRPSPPTTAPASPVLVAASRASGHTPLPARRLRLRERAAVVVELLEWIKASKAWWLAPVLLAIVFLSLIVFIASGSAIAPFFYAIF